MQHPSTTHSHAHHQLHQVYHPWCLCSWQLVPTLLMVSHRQHCMVVLCWLLISMETVHLPIYLQWLKMGVCVLYINKILLFILNLNKVWPKLIAFSIECGNFVFELALFNVVFFWAANSVLHNTCLWIVCCYFTAPCIKVFQLLLGEVNECADWRVSNTLQ